MILSAPKSSALKVTWIFLGDHFGCCESAFGRPNLDSTETRRGGCSFGGIESFQDVFFFRSRHPKTPPVKVQIGFQIGIVL